jgi:hypothetical protein
MSSVFYNTKNLEVFTSNFSKTTLLFTSMLYSLQNLSFSNLPNSIHSSLPRNDRFLSVFIALCWSPAEKLVPHVILLNRGVESLCTPPIWPFHFGPLRSWFICSQAIEYFWFFFWVGLEL